MFSHASVNIDNHWLSYCNLTLCQHKRLQRLLTWNHSKALLVLASSNFQSSIRHTVLVHEEAFNLLLYNGSLHWPKGLCCAGCVLGAL
jgi:hypothetical protein